MRRERVRVKVMAKLKSKKPACPLLPGGTGSRDSHLTLAPDLPDSESRQEW